MSTISRINKSALSAYDLCISCFWRLSNALFEFCKTDLKDNEPKEITREHAFLLAQSIFLQITDNAENEYLFAPNYRRTADVLRGMK
jgi:hypothetical protein